MHHWCRSLIALSYCFFCVTGFAYSQGRVDPGTASPPQWTEDEKKVFFTDAREHLVGDRSEGDSTDRAIVAPTADRPAGTTQLNWSSVVDDETLMTEVKRLEASLNRSLNSVASFRAGVHSQCRSDFSMLAVLFRVIATYDDDVRWQRDADAMKALCLKAADACRHGTEESFEVARQTQQVLGDLLRGQSLQGLGLEVEELGEMTELALLMQRMDRGMKQVSNVPSSNAATFREQSFDIGHEARLMAMLALLIQQDDFYFADDEDYVEQAEALRHFAGELSAACIAEDQQAAVESFRGAVQSCSRCHEDYRG